MNITTILKPAPHCPIPVGHACHIGYVPAEQTRIERTFAKHAPIPYGDDFDRVNNDDWLSAPGGFRS